MAQLKNSLTATVEVNANIEEVWAAWHNPQDIREWNVPDEKWTNSRVENDPRTGGTFFFGMTKKDGSEAFDFTGTYTEVIPLKTLAYTTSDGRSSLIRFNENEQSTIIIEEFEPDPSVPGDLQQAFCLRVLEKFRDHVESKS